MPQSNIGLGADHEWHLVQPLKILLVLGLFLLVDEVHTVLDLQVTAHGGVGGRGVPRLHPLQGFQRVRVLERPLAILRLIPEDINSLIVLDHELELVHALRRDAL